MAAIGGYIAGHGLRGSITCVSYLNLIYIRILNRVAVILCYFSILRSDIISYYIYET